MVMCTAVEKAAWYAMTLTCQYAGNDAARAASSRIATKPISTGAQDAAAAWNAMDRALPRHVNRT